MRALVKDAPGQGPVSVVELDDRAPGPGEARIALLRAGICHTDIAMVDGLLGEAQGYRPHFPVVLGHEFLGRVVALGAGASGVEVGDRVVGSGHLTCRRCRWCTAGRSQLCIDRRTIGIDADGVYAERFSLPASSLVPVPEDVSDELAALAEPFAVSARAVDVAAIRPGERVAVIGPGSVGQLTVAALAGHEVTVIGRPADEIQLERCRTFGATRTVSDPGEIGELSDAFDVVLETAGSGAAVGTGITMLAPGGRIVCVGVPPDETVFRSADLVLRERSIIGTRSYDLSTWRTIPDRLRAAPQLAEIVSHVLPLEKFAEGRDLITSRTASKVVLVP